jgi:glycosyltransferase involved in cell wall biosynthesis
MSARADLHVHSRHSNRPDEWLLRRIAAPESFTEPAEVYRLCRERGMDFVTLSDHDTVAGALEIAHLPGTFLSSEVTVSFPEDGCRIHCLVSGISAAQHAEIQRLRGDVYAFRDYLFDERIVHSVAHPLYRVNDRLTLEHVERLLVLFQRFEGRNGMHDRHLNEMATAVFGSLTEEVLADLAERHRLEPRGERPWEKVFTGGSDDHGGLYVATTWTETPPAATVGEYLAHLAAGDHAPGGEPGSALRLAQSLFAISYRYFQERFAGGLLARNDPFAELLKSLGRPPREPRRWRLPGFVRRAPPAPRPEHGTGRPTVDQVTLERANRACARVLERFARRAAVKLRMGRIGEALGAASHLAPLAVAAAPYAVAFRTQYKDEALLAEVRRALGPPAPPHARERPPAKAWITDTLGEVNGVSRTIRQVAEAAGRRGRDLSVLTCGGPGRLADPPVGLRTFEPLARFPLPAYDGITLAVPPFLELLDHCERRGFDELIVSTPGPLGLAGLAAGRLLGLRVSGVYHTDFPLYVRHLTEDPLLEEATWAYMRWFFGQMDRLYVPSRHYVELLAERGFDRGRLEPMPRGVDRSLFHPGRRREGFWRRHGLGDAPTLLYVGRISKEKNLEALLEAFARLRSSGRRLQLALVGDGPHRKELARRAHRPDVAFTGYLHGAELAAAYASADLFVFPSTTDTFGNAVLEAMASGLPAVVTDRGGPQEIVRRRNAGAVAAPGPAPLAAAVGDLLDAPGRRAEAAGLALETARTSSWDSLLDSLWPAPTEPADPACAKRRRAASGVAA